MTTSRVIHIEIEHQRRSHQGGTLYLVHNRGAYEFPYSVFRLAGKVRVAVRLHPTYETAYGDYDDRE